MKKKDKKQIAKMQKITTRRALYEKARKQRIAAAKNNPGKP
jgi:hypothetical protein